MARAGRKRKLKAQRRETTVEGRKPKLKPTKERQNHFKANTGRDMSNNYDNEDATIIHLLHGARMIDDEQKHAALDYERLLRIRVSPEQSETKEVVIAKGQGGNGSVLPPTHIMDERQIESELLFKDIDARLTSPERKLIRSIVINQQPPSFFIKHRNKEKPTVESATDQATLLSGLNALIGKE